VPSALTVSSVGKPMRKQYHFRPSADGLLAWDVDRLVELSRDLPVESVPLCAIRELDEPYWSNCGTRALTCRDIIDHARLMLECDLSYPVILSSDGRVMDGMHRIAKAALQGQDGIKAVRFREDPQADYVGVAPDDLPY
jgi:hypothetical protein